MQVQIRLGQDGASDDTPIEFQPRCGNDGLMTHQAGGKKVEAIQTRPEIEDEKLAELFGLVRRFEPSELAEFSDPPAVIQPDLTTGQRGIWAWFKRPRH
jgi:hypothetical protein